MVAIRQSASLIDRRDKHFIALRRSSRITPTHQDHEDPTLVASDSPRIDGISVTNGIVYLKLGQLAPGGSTAIEQLLPAAT